MTSMRFRPAGGARIDDVVVDQEIAPFHQLDAHLAGQKGVLEIGRIEDARRQHGDGDVFLKRRQRTQRRQQLPRIMFDRAHAHRAKQVGKSAAHHIAIGEHVGDARRHAQIVLQHDEGAVFAAHQIGAADIDIGAVRHLQSAHLAPVMLGAVDHRARNDAILQHASVAIDVAQEMIERQDALFQARFDMRPLAGGDDARQQIGRNDALGRLLVAIDGEGDALMQEGELAGLLAANQVLRAAASPALRPERAQCGRTVPSAANISS